MFAVDVLILLCVVFLLRCLQFVLVFCITLLARALRDVLHGVDEAAAGVDEGEGPVGLAGGIVLTILLLIIVIIKIISMNLILIISVP